MIAGSRTRANFGTRTRETTAWRSRALAGPAVAASTWPTDVSLCRASSSLARAWGYVGRVDRRRGEPRQRMVYVDRPGVSGERRTAEEEGPRSPGLLPRPTVGNPLATCMLFGFVAVAGRHQLGLTRIVFLLSFREVGGARPLS